MRLAVATNGMIHWIVYYSRQIRSRKLVGLVFVFTILLACIVGNATCFYIFDGPFLEGPARPDVTYEDALWYSVVSITTIGYGDLSATSTGARLGTVFFIIMIGLSTFTLFLGMLVDWMVDFFIKGQLGLGIIIVKNHVLLVNFPGAPRVRQLIEELRSDPSQKKREIVVVTDQIERLPFALDGVLFVNGSPLHMETYERAEVENAQMALVLATSYSDPNSDAVVASAVSVIGNLNDSIHIVAECIDEKHRMLFASVRCNAVVPGLRIAGNLLVQEVDDPGVAQLIDVITSNLKGTTVFSARVTGPPPDFSCLELAKRLLDHDINLLCVNRGDSTFTQFRSVRLEIGDIVIYIAERRMDWPGLVALASS